jgi:signal transduction histidine kinase/CheY-like chemotaxis protein
MESSSDSVATEHAPVGPGTGSNHVVQFYESDGPLCEAVARFLIQGLNVDQPILVVATAAHREGIGEQLALHGVDLPSLRRSGRAMFVDASELLSGLMVDSRVDALSFKRVLGDLLERSRRAGDRQTVRIYGEMVNVLWSDGNPEAALRLEELWNAAAETESFSLLCGYALGHFAAATHSASFEAVCGQHRHAIPTERYIQVPDERDRLQEIAKLQQRAHALAAELQHRRELERTLRLMLADREEAQRERERLLEREHSAREAAEAASRLKDEFLAVMSHELRTPLNAIVGWSQIVNRRDADDATIRRGLGVIEKNAQHQLHIVEDLLDMSRIITGKMVIQMAPVDLSGVLAEAVETVRPALTAKSIDLDLYVDGAAPPIMGDRDRLQQVVWNLLSNAMKFTPSHGRIELRLDRADADAQIVVRDNGLGIEPSFLPYVFDRFRQGDTGTTRTFGGLGVGLAVVRHLVEAHGGTVTAASQGRGCGATFTLRLPARPAASDGAGHPIARRPIELQQARVLVIDDDPDARELSCAALRLSDATVHMAESCDEALRMLSSSHFDVLVADIGMPGRDGFSLIEAVRRDSRESVRRIRAIAVTSYVGDRYRDRAITSGFDEYVAKPVDPGRLAELVADLLRRNTAADASR